MRFLFKNEKRAAVAREPIHSDVPPLNQAQIAAVYYGERMGGDFSDFIRVAPNRMVFGLLDIAGRLEDNREILGAAQHAFREFAPRLLAGDDVNQADAMAELSLQLNRAILDAQAGVRSCPAFAGCYNEDVGTVCYFNAGHTPGLLRDGDRAEPLSATGLPLGLFSHATHDARTVALEPGGALLVVSRGIVESKCDGDEFGLERIEQILARNRGVRARELCLSVLDGVQQFMCTPPTHNDVTALALTREA
jgi:serine phosphatase RsbU (regulator of sigma subunit)